MGDNLQDHIFVDNPIFEVEEAIGINIDKAKSLLSVMDYYVFGQGRNPLLSSFLSFVPQNGVYLSDLIGGGGSFGRSLDQGTA